MCQLRPGPRCSNHAAKSLASWTARHEHAKATADRTKGEAIVGTGSDGDARDAARVAEAVKDRMLAARSAYDATPAGVSELQDLIAKDRELPPEAAELKRRLKAGQVLRASQVAALQEQTGMDAERAGADAVDAPAQDMNPDGSVVVMNEAEAAGLRGALAASGDPRAVGLAGRVRVWEEVELSPAERDTVRSALRASGGEAGSRTARELDEAATGTGACPYTMTHRSEWCGYEGCGGVG